MVKAVSCDWHTTAFNHWTNGTGSCGNKQTLIQPFLHTYCKLFYWVYVNQKLKIKKAKYLYTI